VPGYFAWLQWPGVEQPGSPRAVLAFGLQHIADETADGFTFRVVLRPSDRDVLAVPLEVPRARAVSSGATGGAITTFARNQRLSVAWLAVAGDHDRGGGAAA